MLSSNCTFSLTLPLHRMINVHDDQVDQYTCCPQGPVDAHEAYHVDRHIST